MPWDDLGEALAELGCASPDEYEVGWALGRRERRRAEVSRLARKRPAPGTCQKCEEACPGKWYCSDACRTKAYLERRLAGYAANPRMRRVRYGSGRCLHCGEPCEGRLYCSTSCRTTAWHATHPGQKRVRRRQRYCAGCGDALEARPWRCGYPKWCATCRVAVRAAQQLADSRRSGTARKRASRAGLKKFSEFPKAAPNAVVERAPESVGGGAPGR